MRLHTRTIVRDRHQMFLGSQSLRELELDARREIGIIIHDSKVVNSVVRIFEEDWGSTAVSKIEAAREQRCCSREPDSNESGRGGGQGASPSWLLSWNRWSSTWLEIR